MRHIRSAMQNRTNMLCTLQAFPGNIPWGVIIVYLHDFLMQDLGLTARHALLSIATLAFSAFLGVLVGGFLGESLYKAGSKGHIHLIIFGSVANMFRAFPFMLLFGWTKYFGPLGAQTGMAHFLFCVLLCIGGFVATMASPCTGAMLLNVNLPETRGSVVAFYSVLDDLSKGFGTLLIAMLTPLVGGRAVAYQLALGLWVVCGAAMIATIYTYEEDERQMRRHLDEAAMESMVRMSKEKARRAIKERAKAAGETHMLDKKSRNWEAARVGGAGFGKGPERGAPLRWPTQEHPEKQLRPGSGCGASGSASSHSNPLV